MMLEKRQKRNLISIPFEQAPRLSTWYFFIMLMQGFIPTLQAICVANLLNGMLQYVKTGGNLKDIVIEICLYLALLSFNVFLGKVISIVSVRLKIILREGLGRDLVEHTSKIKYSILENEKIQNLKERVYKDIEVEIMSGFNNFLHLIQLFLQIAGILFIVGFHIWWMPFVVLAFSVPVVWLAIKGSVEQYETHKDTSKLRRKSEYYSRILTNREVNGERAVFQFTDWINNKYKINCDEFFEKNRKMRGKWLVRSKACSILYVFIIILLVLILLPVTLSGRMTLGYFISIMTTSISLVNMISWSLSSYFEGISKWNEFRKDLYKYLDLEEEFTDLNGESGDLGEIRSIELKNVSFTYPGTERKILNGISLTMESGKHYAFVGENGAGKTTLIKILTRLYDSYEGEIFVNGRELRSYPIEYIKNIYSIAYQDFARYDMTLKDNIVLGRNEIEPNIENAIDLVGLTDLIQKYENGWDSYIGKLDEQGVDLSGGEWQKIALARAILPNGVVRILDEPTAALDPINESRLYQQFQTNLKGTMTLFISHRLGSTILADTIYVLSDGKIVEQGSHQELYEFNGIYAQMYEAQRRWYK